MRDITQIIKKNSIAIVIIAALVLVSFLIVALSKSGPEISKEKPGITLEKNGEKVEIYDNGRVIIKRNGREYYDYWDQEKLAAFKEYLKVSSSSSNTFGASGFSVLVNGQEYSLSGDDELVQTIINETSGTSGGGGSSGDDGDLEEYFPTPAPSGSGSGGGGSGSGGSGGGGSGGSSGGSGPSWCKLWRLSYCADPLPTIKPTPTPTPTSSSATPVPYVFDCGLGESLVTDRTVISNTLCIKTPTPTPVN